jgi:hypothetical protein
MVLYVNGRWTLLIWVNCKTLTSNSEAPASTSKTLTSTSEAAASNIKTSASTSKALTSIGAAFKLKIASP